MSDPIAYPSDLGTYLGDASVDPDRATLILELAQSLCESIVSPLPTGARVVVLAVAARAYNNVTSAHQMGLGSAQVSFGSAGSTVGIGGLYLSKSDIATLRRFGGSGGAFSIDPTPADAGSGLSPWDQNVTWLDVMPLIEDR